MSNGQEDCVFCKVINGQERVSTVYEDDSIIVILDIQPVNQGHLLVLPKTHASNLAELDQDMGAHMFKTAMRATEALRSSAVRCEGVNMILADGEIAGQEINHVHLHVIPRFDGDGFGFKFDDSYWVLPDREELDEVASIIAFR
jgi:histidine triad (HIT) family protein